MLEHKDTREHLDRFRNLISGRIGITVSESQDAVLAEVLNFRTRHHHLPSLGDYLFCLENGALPKNGDEWAALSEALTIGESYFFRDKWHFKIFREKIFPDLIEMRETTKHLSIWSAGCAAGEEPFSLAIMLDVNWPELRDWDVRIVGTDINPKVLAAAEKGEYGPWAFRGVDEELRKNYFHPIGETWRIIPSVRKRVEFHYLNLIDAFPGPSVPVSSGFDLIVCRNVFIYFDQKTVEKVTGKLAAALAPGGYLVAGHGEIPLFLNHGLETVRYDEAIVFRGSRPGPAADAKKSQARRNDRTARPDLKRKGPNRDWKLASGSVLRGSNRQNDPAGNSSPSAANRRNFQPGNRFQELSRREKEHEIVKAGENPLAEGQDPSLENFLSLAQTEANLGKLDLAEELCRLAMAKDGFAAGPRWILAQAALERGRLDEAKDHLKKVIYLDQKHVAAFLTLADIFQDENNQEKARKMREAALTVLETMPPDARIEHYEDWSINQLTNKIRLLIK